MVLRFVAQHPLLTVFLLILFGVGAITANTYRQNQESRSTGWANRAITVVTEPARIDTLIDKIESIGTARANESVLLTAKVTDTVRQINFNDGDFVEAGRILVELTNAEETAQLAEARATLDEATRQFERVQNLIRQNLASETQLDNERVRMQTAQARYEAIVARLENRLIRAPFSGLLGFRNISQGTLLTPSTPVTTIDDISQIKLDFDVPETHFAKISRDQDVIARSASYPGVEFAGQVKTIGSRIDPVTRTVTVRAHIENENSQLRPGMLLTVDLIFDRRQALIIPESAVIPVQDNEFVYLVSNNDTAERKAITTGQRRPGLAEVVAGLAEGDEVITQGIIKVRPGVTIRRRNAEEAEG